jgi:hypothetical protein
MTDELPQLPQPGQLIRCKRTGNVHVVTQVLDDTVHYENEDLRMDGRVSLIMLDSLFHRVKRIG